MSDDREWIRANPDRRFRVRVNQPGESGYCTGADGYSGITLGGKALIAVTVVSFVDRGWWSQNLLAYHPVEDSDAAAQRALREYDQEIVPKLCERARVRSWRRKWTGGQS